MRPTELSLAEPSLEEPWTDRAFAASVLEASPDCVKLIGLDGLLIYVNPNGGRLLQVDDIGSLIGRPFKEMWPEAASADIDRALGEAREGRIARFSGEAATAKGVQKWWDVMVSPMLDESGRTKNILAVSRDITEQKRAEEHAHLQAREMTHRVKNLFAVVDGLISMSARRAPEASAFAETLRARVDAFGRAVVYVAPLDVERSELTLHELLADIFAPYDRSRIRVTGENPAIGRAGATTMAMVAHELATNAVKYGALSQPGGRVALDCVRDGETYRLSWTETGGPPAKAPSRTGFGTMLMESSCNTHLAGRIERDWRNEGLAATIIVSAEALSR